jgi:hypothetical protein
VKLNKRAGFVGSVGKSALIRVAKRSAETAAKFSMTVTALHEG